MTGLAYLARLACAAFVAGSVLSMPTPAYAERILCSELDPEKVQRTDARNQPFVDLQVAAAQSVSKGAGVTVAVLDSGVAENLWLPKVTATWVAGKHETQDFPTLVAGLIGGVDGPGRREPLGIAPSAGIVSVKVYDGADATAEDQVLTPDNLARGIDAAVAAGAEVIQVSPASYTGSEALRKSVADAIAADVIVIAAIGERPQDKGQPEFEDFGSYRLDENVQTYPAAYPGVLGVGVGTADGAYDSDLDVSSDAIDVVAPIAELVSTTKNGSTCAVDGGTTAFAAAEASGLAALLVAEHPNFNPAQIAAVIMETATGTTADRSPVDGAGVIQANEAMTRRLRIGRDGTVIQAHQQVDRTPAVSPPGPGDDPFPGMRRSLTWWGVLAGGGLLLALLIRPLLRR